MNIRLLFLLVCMAMALRCPAQKAPVAETRALLKKNNYAKALPAINRAITQEAYRNNAEAWFLRGLGYLMQATSEPSAAAPAAEEAYLSFKRTLELKPDYNAEIDQPLYATAILKFNTAVSLYASSFYAQAYKEFMSVHDMYTAGGTHSLANKEFAALDVEARKNAAYSAINAGHDNDALPLMEHMVEKEAADDPNIYLSLIEIYQATQNEQKWQAMIKSARRQFPDNPLFAEAEQKLRTRQQQLLPRLEESVRNEPGNAALQNSLGTAYLRLAFPKDQRGRPFVVQPLNLAELFTKAENAYSKATSLEPGNASYQYNAGLLYYNLGRLLTNKLYPVKNDSLQFRELDNRRMQEFSRALGYFERSYALLQARTGTLNEQEKETRLNLLQMLGQIYELNGNKEKAAEMEAAISQQR